MISVARVYAGILLLVLLLLLSSLRIQAKPQQIKPGCRYEGRRYQEGDTVTTSEPCLQCSCIEGSLRCRLRVCPRLPRPVPPGCRTRAPADNVCCSKLVCGIVEDESENILQRSNIAIAHHSRIEEARAGCLYEGVRYGPGSAMMGSRRCEYCYCISGARRCIRPKCLLPLPGCAPLYAPHSCCPVAYNCTRQSEFSTTHAATSGNGCRTEQRVYQEGEMVRDIAQKASCDNCFCAMGEIRCVPLSCAPPLQGCKPIVREGQCCPSTYNCSGTIEVKATQNYASYAFISKDYAKFRKETNFYPAIHDSALGAIVEGRGHRVVNEVLESDDATSSSSSSSPLEISTEKFAMATESIPTLETETMNNEILSETTDYPEHTTRDQEQLTATITEFTASTDTSSFDQSTITARDSIDETTAEATSLPSPTLYLREVSTTLEDTWTETTLASTLLPTTTSGGGDDTSVVVDENAGVTTAAATTTTTASTSVTTIREAPESSSIIATAASTTKPRENCVRHGPELESTSTDKGTTSSINLNPSTSTTAITSTASSTSSSPSPTTTKPTRPPTTSTTATSQSRPAVEKAGDKHQKPGVTEVDKAAAQAAQKKVDADELKMQRPITSKKPSSSGLSTSVIVPDDMLVMNVTVKTNVAVEHIHGVTINPIGKPDIVEAILNITNRGKGDDYELDYSQPTLPPSLPGVRIIPFVAADALVKDKDESVVGISGAVTGYPPRVGVVVPPPLPPEISRTDAANFYDIVTQENRFSPPKKTEGGFVPKDPTYFDPLFHPSSINLEIGTGVTVAPDVHPVPNPHRKIDGLPHNCLYEEREYDHGKVLPSRALCVICICYYGEVVCSDRKCPPLKIGCKRVSDPNDKCCSKVVCVNGLESPTVVLSGETVGSFQQHEPTVSPDPFRDVIKTEPAPDLPSLIGAMIPYLVEHSLTTPVGINRNPSLPLDFDDYIGGSPRNDTHLLQPSSASSSLLQHQPDSNVVREDNASSSSIADKISLTNPPDLDPDPIVIMEPPTPGEPDEADASSIFSGVLDLFFNEPSTTITSITTSSSQLTETTTTTTTTTKAPPTTSETPSTRSATSEASLTSASGSGTDSTSTATTSVDSAANSGLLKLAGCNIYGRMYRVGMIISELSGPCSECRCTEHGVECKNLDC